MYMYMQSPSVNFSCVYLTRHHIHVGLFSNRFKQGEWGQTCLKKSYKGQFKMIKIKTNRQLYVARVGVRVSGVGAEPIHPPPPFVCTCSCQFGCVAACTHMNDIINN